MNQKKNPLKKAKKNGTKIQITGNLAFFTTAEKTNAFYLPKEWLGPAGLLISPTLFQLQFF
jgi:hypothetical protein